MSSDENNCVVRAQIQEIQIDGLKSQLNCKLINFIWKKKSGENMPNLRSFGKGAFLLVREVVTSPMRANHMVKFYS